MEDVHLLNFTGMNLDFRLMKREYRGAVFFNTPGIKFELYLLNLLAIDISK